MQPPSGAERGSDLLTGPVLFHQAQTIQRISLLLDQMINAGQANKGGVSSAGRSVTWTRFEGLDKLIADGRRRKFHVSKAGDQIVVQCHEADNVIHLLKVPRWRPPGQPSTAVHAARPLSLFGRSVSGAAQTYPG